MTLPFAWAQCLDSTARGFRVNSGPYVSKTDQTDQTDQRIETAEQFGTVVGPELTRPAPKLTSGTAQRLHSRVVVGVPIDSAHARASDGAQP